MDTESVAICSTLW